MLRGFADVLELKLDCCRNLRGDLDELVAAFRDDIDAYMAREVLPHVPNAWVDYGKTKAGYEIPINRHFYVYKPPRPLSEIEKEVDALEKEIAGLLHGLVKSA